MDAVRILSAHASQPTSIWNKKSSLNDIQQVTFEENTTFNT